MTPQHKVSKILKEVRKELNTKKFADPKWSASPGHNKTTSPSPKKIKHPAHQA
jgi:hypothetical protein